MPLADRYHELMGLRNEGLRKYKTNVADAPTSGPPVHITLPKFGLGEPYFNAKRLGRLFVEDRRPIITTVDRYFAARRHPISVLEIGPGDGKLAEYIQHKYGSLVRHYYGLERDQHVLGAYERIESPEECPEPVDLLIASEVAEHMPADMFFDSILTKLRDLTQNDATLILSVPNALTPGGISRDFTHSQHYPWYDLYAILRLEFVHVTVARTHYLWSPKRVLKLLPRMAMCSILELDWAEQLICTAQGIR